MVETNQRHLVLRHDDHDSPVALVGPERDGAFVVQFLLAADDERTCQVREDVTREIDFYLVEKGEPRPWAYAIYHCGTMANVYSRVHWACYDPEKRERS